MDIRRALGRKTNRSFKRREKVRQNEASELTRKHLQFSGLCGKEAVCSVWDRGELSGRKRICIVKLTVRTFGYREMLSTIYTRIRSPRKNPTDLNSQPSSPPLLHFCARQSVGLISGCLKHLLQYVKKWHKWWSINSSNVYLLQFFISLLVEI